ncbi:DUF2076 domain-containing protein [Dyella koreensis]|uniref:DUF2076 domain-containing protein n=1 Tax=Dyella koreensis TaxID=311235 RepID=A0ABW8K7Y1_9GAMM
MNQDEYLAIAGIFDRLKQAEHQPRDPEAEALIREKIVQQPYAPYAMAQTIFVQEQALANLHERVQQLEGELQKAKSTPVNNGFLSSLFGSVGRSERQPSSPTPAASSAPASSPPTPGSGGPAVASAGTPGSGVPAGAPSGISGAPPAPSNAAPGGSFLASAMTTAAGVAGGMVVGNVLTNALGLGAHGSAHAASDDHDTMRAAQPRAETVADTNDGAVDDDFDGDDDDS